MREESASSATLTPCQRRYRFANIEFDEATLSLRVDQQLVAVERRPLLLLACLLRHADETLERQALLTMVWEGRPTVEHVLASAVSKLRSALGPQASRHLVTVPRTGYRLDGPVQSLDSGNAARKDAGWAPGTRLPGPEDLVLINRLAPPEPLLQAWLARSGTEPGLRRVWVAHCPEGRARLAAWWTQATRLRRDLAAPKFLDLPLSAALEHTPAWLVWDDDAPSLAQAHAPEIALADWPLERRLSLFLHLADAVSTLHAAAWVHDALCPAHIQLVGPRRPADLRLSGLLHARRADAPATPCSGLAPQHLAPERLLGQPGSVQTDVYALGVLLYQVLMARPGLPLSTGWERTIEDPELRDDIRAATEGDPALRLDSVQALSLRLRQRDSRRAARLAAAEQALQAAQQASARARARQRRPWIALAALGVVIGLGLRLWPATGATTQQDARADPASSRQAMVLARSR